MQTKVAKAKSKARESKFLIFFVILGSFGVNTAENLLFLNLKAIKAKKAIVA